MFSFRSICLHTAFAFFALVSYVVEAKSVPPRARQVQLLTYHQMAALSPKQRVRYVKDVGQMLVMLEDMQIRATKAGLFAASESSRGEMMAAIKSWLALMPDATAEDGPESHYPKAPLAAPAAPERPPVAYPVYYGGGNWGCTSNADPAKAVYEFNETVGTCVRKDSDQNFVPTPLKGTSIALRNNCNAGEEPVYITTPGTDAPTGRSYCASITALGLTDEATREKLINPESKYSGSKAIFTPFAKNQPNGEQRAKDLVYGDAGPVRNSLMQGDASLAAGHNGVDPTTLKDQSKPAAAPADPATPTVGADPAPACDDFDAKARADLRGKLAGKSGKPPVCLNSGNFSAYNSAKAQAGGCKTARRASTYTNLVYADESGAPLVGKGGKPVTTCPLSTSLCAPEIFCDSSKADTDQHVTAFCINLKGDDDDHKAMNFTQLCSRVSTQPCDPNKITGPTEHAASDTRDAFKKNYDAYCVADESFKQFFCNECNALATKASAWLTKTPAADQPDASPPDPSKITQ